MQQVFLPIMVQEEALKPVKPPAAKKPALFAKLAPEVLLGYGVPQEWLADVLEATEDTLLILLCLK